MVKLEREVYRDMLRHALQEAPNECCGLLAGRDERIFRIQECTNALASPVRFSIPPPELFQFFRSLRERDLEFLGIYHSHPDGDPFPSGRDRQELHYHDVSYWIIALKSGQPVVACYKWKAPGLAPQEFEIVERTVLPQTE